MLLQLRSFEISCLDKVTDRLADWLAGWLAGWLTASLSPWIVILFEKQFLCQLNSPRLVKFEGSRVYKSPPCVHIRSQMNGVHAIPFDFSKINFNIIFSSSKLYPSLRFAQQNPLRAKSPARLVLRDLTTRITFGGQYLSWSSSLCIFFNLFVRLCICPSAWKNWPLTGLIL